MFSTTDLNIFVQYVVASFVQLLGVLCDRVQLTSVFKMVIFPVISFAYLLQQSSNWNLCIIPNVCNLLSLGIKRRHHWKTVNLLNI